jgi:hypothetical protein
MQLALCLPVVSLRVMGVLCVVMELAKVGEGEGRRLQMIVEE